MSRPYFETKVVKVKKEEELKFDYCPCCGAKREAEKPIGNWVNGENLDKIKFPCFCSFMYGSERCYGEINSNHEKSGDREYTMTDLTKQTKGLSIVYGYNSLEQMIEELRVKIKPGKIIIYEEEK